MCLREGRLRQVKVKVRERGCRELRSAGSRTDKNTNDRFVTLWCPAPVDPICGGFCACGKGGCGKSKCGKGNAENCDPLDDPVGADDLGYCQKISNGAAVADKECYMGKGYDENDCDSWGANWHWCEKSEPIDPCEGSCYTGGKKNGGYFEDVSYCRRKSSMQCYIQFTKTECESWNSDYVWCEKSQNICDVYDDGAGCTKCLKVKDMNHCYDADNSKAKCDSWGKDYLWCGNYRAPPPRGRAWPDSTSTRPH